MRTISDSDEKDLPETESNDSEPEPEVPASELGTKAYWDSYYESEIKNFENCGIRDDGWFGQGCRKRVIQYLNKTSKPKTSFVLDLGCGNGEMIQLLSEDGWKNITGYDYSEPAISLCKMVFKDKEGIDFEVADLTGDIVSDPKYNICLDKGTFDAISINPDKPRVQCVNAYFQNVSKLLKNQGLLVITSCNWTENEIIEMAKDCFILKDRIPCPTISFGGKSGSQVSTVVLIKSS